MSIGSFPHKAETLIIFTPHSFFEVRKSVSPSRGSGGTGLVQGFVTRFGTRFARVLCGVHRFLKSLVLRFARRLEHVFILLANQGAYFNSVLNIR